MLIVVLFLLFLVLFLERAERGIRVEDEHKEGKLVFGQAADRLIRNNN